MELQKRSIQIDDGSTVVDTNWKHINHCYGLSMHSFDLEDDNNFMKVRHGYLMEELTDCAGTSLNTACLNVTLVKAGQKI